MPKITLKELQERLSYSPDTGVFTWLVPTNSTKVGDTAGCVNCFGYVVIKLKQRLYKAHSLAWFYTHGSWPVHQIDHIDRVRYNNSIANLRQSTAEQNALNRSLSFANSSGKTGVTQLSNGKWQARFRGKYLGCSADISEAESLYTAAKSAAVAEFDL